GLDPSLVQASLATSLHEAAGIRPATTEHVLLALNGEYMGVYTRVEQVDEGFLLRTGRNPGASIYKVVDRFAEILPSEAAYRAYYEKKTNEDLGHEDVISFVELINYTPDEDFAAAISAVMDVELFLDRYAVIVLTADADSGRHNIYLIHDLDTDLWELIPWDLEIGFGVVTAPIDMGTQEHPFGPGGWNLLRTRVLRVPEFRAYYCQRLDEYMNTIFRDDVLHPQVDAVWGAIVEDGLRDWRKPEWEGNTLFLDAPARIKAFITHRKEFLRGEMATYCP
ncbi:MAG: CotH kinase family protein, partial [Anaerolineae bacterium]